MKYIEILIIRCKFQKNAEIFKIRCIQSIFHTYKFNILNNLVLNYILLHFQKFNIEMILTGEFKSYFNYWVNI